MNSYYVCRYTWAELHIFKSPQGPIFHRNVLLTRNLPLWVSQYHAWCHIVHFSFQSLPFVFQHRSQPSPQSSANISIQPRNISGLVRIQVGFFFFISKATSRTSK